MRIVLDTNVLVSAILTPGGPAHQILLLVLRGELQLCVDGRIVSEYREVLTRRKFGFPPEVIGRFLGSLLEEAQQVLPAPLAGRLPDEDDRVFLEVAVAGQVEALITGNVRHFQVAARLRIPVKAPSEFLTWWRNRQ